MRKTPVKVGTLFSGIGAPEFAIDALLPYEIEFACDNNPSAKTTYLANHKCKTFYDDISNIKSLPYVDLLIFGFPCQPFSFAGKQNGIADPRGQLLLTALKLIRKSKPRHVIAENVEGLAKIDNGKVLKYIIRKFRRMGYNVSYSMMDALSYGLPQKRNRLWIVATKSKNFRFPKPCNYHKPLQAVLDAKIDPRTVATYKFITKSKVQQKLKSYKNDYINCITHTIARNGSSSEYISYVSAIHNACGQYRKPTIKECSRLFGFPDHFQFPLDIPITHQYEMFGNSMAVPVVKSIIKKLF